MSWPAISLLDLFCTQQLIFLQAESCTCVTVSCCWRGFFLSGKEQCWFQSAGGSGCREEQGSASKIPSSSSHIVTKNLSFLRVLSSSRLVGSCRQGSGPCTSWLGSGKPMLVQRKGLQRAMPGLIRLTSPSWKNMWRALQQRLNCTGTPESAHSLVNEIYSARSLLPCDIEKCLVGAPYSHHHFLLHLLLPFDIDFWEVPSECSLQLLPMEPIELSRSKSFRSSLEYNGGYYHCKAGSAEGWGKAVSWYFAATSGKG